MNEREWNTFARFRVCQVDFFFILLIWKADFFYLSSPLLPNAKLTSHLKCIFGKLDFGKNSM